MQYILDSAYCVTCLPTGRPGRLVNYFNKIRVPIQQENIFLEIVRFPRCFRHCSIYSFKSINHERVFIITERREAHGE